LYGLVYIWKVYTGIYINVLHDILRKTTIIKNNKYGLSQTYNKTN